MSHNSTINLESGRDVLFGGGIINMHDIKRLTLNDDCKVTEVELKTGVVFKKSTTPAIDIGEAPEERNVCNSKQYYVCKNCGAWSIKQPKHCSTCAYSMFEYIDENAL